MNQIEDLKIFLNELSQRTLEFELELFYFGHFNNLDLKYECKEVNIDTKLQDFLKSNIIDNLNRLKVEDEFYFTNYNNEFHVNETLPVINIDEFESIKNNLELIYKSMSENKLDMKNASFHLLKIHCTSKNEWCYFGYYRGEKGAGRNKKLGILLEEYKEVTESVIEVGGYISFIIYKNYIIVNNPQHFEWAFKYSEHIEMQRDSNIDRIVNQNIFANQSSIDYFRSEATKYVRSRSMAQISEDTLSDLKSHFDDRCNELKDIKDAMEKRPSSVDSLKKELDIVYDLMKFINFENNTIEIKESDKNDLTPVIYLFQNKIVTSYLTQKIQSIIGYREE
ncbi:Kiwa anti-phage protein KwaB-like domain-containing protein [Nosocomiicoccus ampullae]|uniref:DUF4868 domain-containing protein n=1 Tax=Nosocomiicoccus ampullae TaxID=489910 RepID=A0A9Q2CXM5_9STAP|nr:Kiwa anti-phage protein KwaB-like domain-containing protein [Nosocomiicoccus ampullae]MBB5175265.1 hypothetical protein [Nosocomiicoccus ampullae]QYA46359.1 DUF4868 domain-containing protein [Nosocomiicoccus ampullae]